LPPLLVLAATVLASIENELVLTCASVLFVFLDLPLALKTYPEHWSKEDWRGAVTATTQQARDKDAVVVFPASSAISLAYYERNISRRRLPATVYPDERTFRFWQPFPDPASSSLQALACRHSRVWLLADADYPKVDLLIRPLKNTLTGAFKRVRIKHFTRIDVMLYEVPRSAAGCWKILGSEPPRSPHAARLNAWSP
jgi:hypothetical protein